MVPRVSVRSACKGQRGGAAMTSVSLFRPWTSDGGGQSEPRTLSQEKLSALLPVSYESRLSSIISSADVGQQPSPAASPTCRSSPEATAAPPRADSSPGQPAPPPPPPPPPPAVDYLSELYLAYSCGYGPLLAPYPGGAHLPAAGPEAQRKLRPKKHRCPHCHVAFSNNGQLRGHVRIHTGERPFRCSCGKSFTRNEELTRHKRIHSGVRPFACAVCDKRFGRKDHLKKHARTHAPPVHLPVPYPLPYPLPFLYGL